MYIYLYPHPWCMFFSSPLLLFQKTRVAEAMHSGATGRYMIESLVTFTTYSIALAIATVPSLGDVIVEHLDYENSLR